MNVFGLLPLFTALVLSSRWLRDRVVCAQAPSRPASVFQPDEPAPEEVKAKKGTLERCCAMKKQSCDWFVALRTL